MLSCTGRGTISLRLKPFGCFGACRANGCFTLLFRHYGHPQVSCLAVLQRLAWFYQPGALVDTFLVWCWDQGLGLPRSCGCHRHLVVLRLVFLLLEVLHAVRVFLRPETGVQIYYLCPHHCAKITHWFLVKYLSIVGVVRLLDTFLKTGQSGDLCLQPLSPKVSRQPLGMSLFWSFWFLISIKKSDLCILEAVLNA